MPDETTVPEGSTEAPPVAAAEPVPAPAAKPKRTRNPSHKPKVARSPVIDADHDGLPDINPAAAELLLLDLVPLDTALREHGSSVASLLRFVAKNSLGVEV